MKENSINSTIVPPEPHTVIHQRIQGITDAILSLTYQKAEIKDSVKTKVNSTEKVTDIAKAGLADIANAINKLQLSVTVPTPNISLNISVYILLINLNIFIWWWLCRNEQSPMACFLGQMRESAFYDSLMRASELNPKLQKQFEAVLELPVKSSSLTAESAEEQTLLQAEEDEKQWQERAAMIQDLCIEMLGSLGVESPEARQQVTLADVSQKLDSLIQQTAPPSPLEPFLPSEGLEEQLTEEILAQALPLLHEISQVEASLTQENLDVANLDHLEKQLQALQTKLAEHTDLFNEELARSASEPLQNNTTAVRYHRLIQLQKLRQLILQYFASNS